LRFDRRNHSTEVGEVAIVKAEAPRQFPNALNWVQVRTVGRQVAQSELRLLLGPPRGVQFGVVIFGVVANYHHAPPGASTALPERGQKIPCSHSIKAAGFATEEEPAIAQADGSKITNAFARGRVQENWVGHFWRHPKAPARAVLLEMNFIDRPQVNAGIGGQGVEFFYAWLVFARPPGPRPGAVCGSENPIGERAVDIGGP
jgi:hypothetical protein